MIWLKIGKNVLLLLSIILLIQGEIFGAVGLTILSALLGEYDEKFR